MVTNNQLKGSLLTTDAVSKAAAAEACAEGGTCHNQEQVANECRVFFRPAAWIDELLSLSIGIVAAWMMDVEPENLEAAMAKYREGVLAADTPGGATVLHSIYHFVKRFEFP
jgi:hypothetical protein